MGSVDAAQLVQAPDDALAAIDACFDNGWTDGLPVVPPEQSRVEAMLAMEGRPAETVIATHPTTGLECSILGAAANAVMAGCLPEYFPVVVAALEAANETAYHYHGSAASTGGSCQMLIVSGPVVQDIGMNAAGNVFGPGNRANATIGRAMRLILLNVFRMTPGIADQSTQGHPGKYTMCIAERSERSPWPPLHEEFGYGPDISSVTVFAGAGFCNVENHGGNTPQSILDSVADSMANLGCITAGQSVVVLSPEHAEIIASTGWSKGRCARISLRAGAPAGGRDAAGDEVCAARVRAPRAPRHASRLQCGRHPDHGRRRRRWRPLGLHPFLEPRPRLADADQAHWRLRRLLNGRTRAARGSRPTRTDFFDERRRR